MRTPAAVLLLLAASVAVGGGGAMFADGGDAGSSRDPDFRFQASLWWDRGEAPLCGAAVIDARNLLTAAHCLFDGVIRPTRRPTNFLRVTAGSADYQKAASYEVAYTYTPYSFDTLGVDNDVAVIRLKKPMQLGEGVRSLPLASSPPAPGSVCQLSGWGAWANRGDSNATTLRHVEVVVQAPGRCDAGLPAPLICVAPNNGGAYTHADDGGPLTCSGRLAGVVARSGRGGLVVAATDVSRHLGFVADAVSHPGQDAWPFASSVMAGCCVAAACLTVTALLARVADARAAR